MSYSYDTATSSSAGGSSGGSQGSNQASSWSYPALIPTPQSDWSLQLSQLMSMLGGHQYDWARNELTQARPITGENISRYLDMSQAGTGLAGNLINQYQDKFQPLMDNYLRQAATYGSRARQEFEAGKAESTVAQASKAAQDAAEKKLQGFGIDPSSGRYQDLMLSSRVQDAAARAGAGTEAMARTDAMGRQMQEKALAMGQNIPGMAVNALNAGYQGVTGAQNSLLGYMGAGASLTGSAAPFFNAAGSAIRMPLTGTISGSESSGSNTSSQSSSNTSRSSKQGETFTESKGGQKQQGGGGDQQQQGGGGGGYYGSDSSYSDAGYSDSGGGYGGTRGADTSDFGGYSGYGDSGGGGDYSYGAGGDYSAGGGGGGDSGGGYADGGEVRSRNEFTDRIIVPENIRYPHLSYYGLDAPTRGARAYANDARETDSLSQRTAGTSGGLDRLVQLYGPGVLEQVARLPAPAPAPARAPEPAPAALASFYPRDREPAPGGGAPSPAAYDRPIQLASRGSNIPLPGGGSDILTPRTPPVPMTPDDRIPVPGGRVPRDLMPRGENPRVLTPPDRDRVRVPGGSIPRDLAPVEGPPATLTIPGTVPAPPDRAEPPPAPIERPPDPPRRTPDIPLPRFEDPILRDLGVPKYERPPDVPRMEDPRFNRPPVDADSMPRRARYEGDYGYEPEYAAAAGGMMPPRGPTTGGRVPMQASPSMGRETDDVPARLNAGEYVIPRDVVQWKGQDFFRKLIEQSRRNRTGMPGPPPKPKMKPSLRLNPTFVSENMG